MASFPRFLGACEELCRELPWGFCLDLASRLLAVGGLRLDLAPASRR